MVSFAQVDTVWVRRYNSPDHFQDYAQGIGVSGSGNVYVTGTSLHGSPISYEDIVTLKYSAQGDSIWAVRYDGPWEDNDSPLGLQLDMTENIYVCGYSMGIDATFDYTTIKYTTTGDTLWVRYQNGPWGSNDYPSDFVLDSMGNLYITGMTNSAWTMKDYMTVKYNGAGDTLWLRIYDHQTSRDDSAAAIAVDVNGNVYVAGTSYDYSHLSDYATMKYDTWGNEIWIARYNGPSDSADIAIDIAVDNSGNTYVTGKSWTAGYGYDIITIKYNSIGDTLWTRSYNGTGNNDDYPTAMIIDPSGNIYVTGCSHESTIDFCLIKYDVNGNELWVKHYDGPGNNNDIVRAITLDDSGNVYITGESYGLGTNFDYATIRYDRFGNQNWVARYERSSIDRSRGIAVDSLGYIYVTGESSFGAGAYFDYLTIKYSQNTGIVEQNQGINAVKLFTKNSLFRDRIEIGYAADINSTIWLKIYDVNGCLVKNLSSHASSSGTTHWNGRDDDGKYLPAGIYFIHLEVGNISRCQKVIKIE